MTPTKKALRWADGKEMVWIPAGQTVIGSENGLADEQPCFSYTTNGFYMDATPVTNAEYKRFCDATHRGYPAPPPWPGRKGVFLEEPDHPVVNVSYGDCVAYAAWAGKRLPREAEWEYAARGGLSQATYPWGNQPVFDRDGVRANFADKCSGDPWAAPFADDGYEKTAPVGRYAPNGYGLYDMAGNVYEYVNDWLAPYPLKEDVATVSQDGWGGSRVCRGGGYHSPAEDLRISRRHCILGGGANEAVGFRCVSDTSAIPADACREQPPRTTAAAQPWYDKLEDLIRQSPGPGDCTELCCGVDARVDASLLRQLKIMGFTSVEQYVTWRTCEGAGMGQWDFSHWDQEAAKIRQAGLKWLPFLIAGPAYSLPDWFARSHRFQGMMCAEHRLPSKVQSPWDRSFYKQIDRFLKAFAARYGDTDLLEGILLGVSGDFGEAIVSVWHGNWPTNTAGTYHAHAGYWCADPFAIADYRAAMRQKYKTVEKLNTAWECDCHDFDALDFPPMEVGPERSSIDGYTSEGLLLTRTPGERRRAVDFVDWYRASMTRYVGVWMKTARKYFPYTKIYLCTGGEAQPCHASEFAWQSKVCAAVGGGVRITNEDSNYEKNFCITNWVASACTFYGADFSFEPAGNVDRRGVVCRVYNAAATGANGLHYYAGNLSDEPRCRSFVETIARFDGSPVKRDTALFYPDVAMMTDPARRPAMYKAFEAMRDFGDYAYADDLTVKDGILDGMRVLVLAVGGVYRRETLRRIERFVRQGGLLVGLGLDSLRSLEDDADAFTRLFDPDGVRLLGKGKTLHLSASPANDLSDTEIDRQVFDPLAAFLRDNGVYVPDGKRDRLYVCIKKDGLLVMNYSGRSVVRTVSRPDGSTVTLSLSDTAVVRVGENG